MAFSRYSYCSSDTMEEIITTTGQFPLFTANLIDRPHYFSSNYRHLVFYIDSIAVACMILEENYKVDNSIHMTCLEIALPYRGKGYGKMAMNMLRTIALEEPVPSITLTPIDIYDSERPITSFYSSLGYKEEFDASLGEDHEKYMVLKVY